MSLVWAHSWRGPWFGPSTTKLSGSGLLHQRAQIHARTHRGPDSGLKLNFSNKYINLSIKTFFEKTIIYFYIPIPISFFSSPIPPLPPPPIPCLERLKLPLGSQLGLSYYLVESGPNHSLMPMLSKVSLHRQWTQQSQFMHRVISWSHFQLPHRTPLPRVFQILFIENAILLI